MLINRDESNYDLFFLASIKLLTNNIIDKAEVTTIDKTLSKPAPPDSIFLGKVIPQRATNIRIKIQLDNVRSQVSLAINA